MNIKLILKSFIIGIGKIIPGVSGSMLAMTLGIYEEIIEAITDFFGDTKKHLKLLINFGIGLLGAIIIFSKVILFLITNYYQITMSLFLGLIIGTVFKFSKKLNFNKKNISIFILFFILIISLAFFSTNLVYVFKPNVLNYLYVMLLGFIDAATSIIPGISGTAIFMLLGSYTFVLETLASPLTLPFILYGLGLIIGIIIISYLMNYLLKKYQTETHMLIFAFSLGSVFLVLLPLLSSFSLSTLILLLLGTFLGYIFDN